LTSFSVSDELDLGQNHMISPDGYNIGRDDFIKKATSEPKQFLLDEFTTSVIMIDGLLSVGAEGVNHGKIWREIQSRTHHIYSSVLTIK